MKNNGHIFGMTAFVVSFGSSTFCQQVIRTRTHTHTYNMNIFRHARLIKPAKLNVKLMNVVYLSAVGFRSDMPQL